MKKYVNSESAYEIMDKLFAQIQKNNYVATEQMLNDAWSAWIKLPNAFNIFEVSTRLKSLADNDMKISYGDIISIIADEEQNGDSRTCKFCGRSRKEEIIFPVKLNHERIYTCQDCLSKQKNVQSLEVEYPLADLNEKADKKINLFVHFLKPELFGNAEYAKVGYTYENEIDIKKWEVMTKVNLVASALGLEEDEVIAILQKKKSEEVFDECYNVYKSIEFCSEEEYNNR